MKNKKRKTRFEKFANNFLSLCLFIAVVGGVMLSSYRNSVEVKCQKVNDEIESIQANIDGLNIEIQQLVAFERIEKIANENGFTYQSDAVALQTALASE